VNRLKSDCSVVYCPTVLLLKDIERDSNGNITAGFVMNGLWFFRKHGSTCFAYYNKHNPKIVNQWEYEDDLREIQIPYDLHGGYNYVIEAAEEFKATGRWPKAPKKPAKDYSDMDDDIPF